MQIARELKMPVDDMSTIGAPELPELTSLQGKKSPDYHYIQLPENKNLLIKGNYITNIFLMRSSYQEL